MAGQIEHLNRDILCKEMELNTILQPHFTPEEMEQAFAQDTTIAIKCEKDIIVEIEPVEINQSNQSI
jgi:hypothetical protein